MNDFVNEQIALTYIVISCIFLCYDMVCNFYDMLSDFNAMIYLFAMLRETEIKGLMPCYLMYTLL